MINANLPGVTSVIANESLSERNTKWYLCWMKMETRYFPGLANDSCGSLLINQALQYHTLLIFANRHETIWFIPSLLNAGSIEGGRNIRDCMLQMIKKYLRHFIGKYMGLMILMVSKILNIKTLFDNLHALPPRCRRNI